MRKKYSVKCPTCNGTGRYYINWLQKRREEIGLDQQQLSELLGIGRSQVSNIERGKSDLTADKVRPYADALDVTVEDLLTGLYGEKL